MSCSRRNFLKLGGAGVIATQLPAGLAARSASLVPGNAPFELGIASYSLREFSLDETIAMTLKLRLNKLCLKSMHLPLDLESGEIRKEAGKVRNAGIDLYGAGVVYMKNEQEVRNAFRYASDAGMKVIVGVPEHELLDLCNEHVKKTGIGLAIHNHGPGDERYPTPESAYKRVQNMDPGMGLCVDIGHTARLGLDPVKETARFMDRVHDIHIKDVDGAHAEGETCEIGTGVIEIPGFLEMLIREKYSRVVSFEYEKDAQDPLAGLAESVGYVRGVLEMLG